MIDELCSQTDTGLARDNNEDAVAFDPASQLFILADGMGGYNAGEVASAMAVSFINAELGRWLLQVGGEASLREIRRAMTICVDNANHAVFDAAHTNAHYAGMGTTLVVGVFQADRLVLGHIGDSRCYRLRGRVLQQITKDHSLLQEQLDAGLITPQQAITALNKNLVTRALGVEDAVLLDVHEHRVEAGDVYLICSDGLSDMLTDEQIAKILNTHVNLVEKAQHLVTAANDNGGRDNISVLLGQALEDHGKKSLLHRMLRK